MPGFVERAQQVFHQTMMYSKPEEVSHDYP